MTEGNIVAKWAQEQRPNFFLGVVQTQKWMVTMTEYLVKVTQGFRASPSNVFLTYHSSGTPSGAPTPNDKSTIYPPVSYTHLDVYKRQGSASLYLYGSQSIEKGCAKKQMDLTVFFSAFLTFL